MVRDLRHALRSVKSRPGPAAIVVLTLAIAIGVNTAIFSVVHGVLIRPLAYDSPERLVTIWENNREQGQEEVQTSTTTYVDWRTRTKTLESVAVYQYVGYTLTGDGDPVRVPSVRVSPALFRVLGVDPLLGRTLIQEDEVPGNERLVVLSHGAWSRHFGQDPGIVGRTVEFDGDGYTVVGVMPSGFEFPAGDPSVEAWSPLTLDVQTLASRPHRMLNAIGRLRPDVTLEQAQADMSTVARQIAAEDPKNSEGWGVSLVPTRDQLVGDIRSTLWVLFGAVTLVLITGCVNVSNLLLVRSTEAARGYAIRATLGAGSAALLKRSLTESLVLAGLGGLTGVGVAYGAVAFLRNVIPDSIPRAQDIGLDVTALSFALGVALLAGLAVGLLPALRAMRPNLGTVIQESGRGAGFGRRARLVINGLVAVQVALAIVLLIGAGLMVRSFDRLTKVDPGFRTEGVVTVAVALPRSRYTDSEAQRLFFNQLVERVRGLAGVEEVGAVSALPMSTVGVEFEMPFSILGLDAESPTERPRADYRGVVTGYFPAMAIPLVRGRLFNELDGADGRGVALVNERLADRYFRDRDPIGQMLDVPMAGSLTIVGVVGDVHHEGLSSDTQPEMFVPITQLALSEMHVVVYTTLDESVMSDRIRQEVLALDPDLPPTEVGTVAERLTRSVAEPRFNMALLIGLALSALVLSCIGVYGVVSYAVVQRTGEIGLRMALGAGSGETARLVVAGAVRVVIVGVILGLAGSAALSRLMVSLLYGITPTDSATYLTVAGGIVLLGALAAALPALRAARIDPIVALRVE
jgi:putative ABC transport system permease protein